MKHVQLVEVAHQIQEWIKTVAAIKMFEVIEQDAREREVQVQVFVPDRLDIRMGTPEFFHTISIPSHVIRHLVDSGAVLKSCKTLANEHDQALQDLAGITVELD